jgi:hypothetical protein
MIRLYEDLLRDVVIRKEGRTMAKSKSIRIASAVVALMLVAAVAHAGWTANHENRVKFSRPVALPGVVLPAGTYSFDVASEVAHNLVVVRSADHRKLFYMGFTNSILRPRNMPSAMPIAFAEAAANEVPPIAAWYEIDGTAGHEFIYR